MKIYFSTRPKARTFAQANPTNRKAGSVKSDQGWSVLLGKHQLNKKG